MKIKKQHRKKKYLHKLNRKRMNAKQRGTGEVKCNLLKEAWDNKKSTLRNLNEMGLADDPNKVIKIPNIREIKLKQARTMLNQYESDEEDASIPIAPKIEIVETLEKQARAPRQRKFMLPKGQVEFITYLLDKYGHDYKAMERDKKNYYQETWKQLRAKIKKFIGIPKQYGEYLQARGLLDNEENEAELKQLAKSFIVDD